MSLIKKLFITIFFTIFVVIYTAQIWRINYIPVIIDLVGGKSKVRVEVRLCEGKYFEKCEDNHVEVHPLHPRKVELRFYDVKHPKIIFFHFSKLKTNAPLIIKNINLISKRNLLNEKKIHQFIGYNHKSKNLKLVLYPRYIISDINKYLVENSYFLIKKQIRSMYDDYSYTGANIASFNLTGLTLIRRTTIIFWYDGKLNFWYMMHTDFGKLSIIILLSILLIFINADNISRLWHDVWEKHSKADIFFLALLFICLLIPMYRINMDKVSDIESRALSVYKPIFDEKHNVNLNYGRDFENWINDRFLGRDQLITFKTVINCAVNQYSCESANNIEYYKKANLMFDGGSGILGLSKIKKDKKKDILKTYVKNLRKFQKYCDNNNIKLYFLIAPRKMDFFDYKLPYVYSADQADEVIEYIKKHTKTNMIYPKKELLKTNNITPGYYKTDHHWTKEGAYVGYYELMKLIRKDFPEVPIVEKKDMIKYYSNLVSDSLDEKLNYGSTFKRMHLPLSYAKNILDTKYLYYMNPQRKNLLKVDNLISGKGLILDPKEDAQFYYKNGSDKKVLLIGNSFAGNLMEYIPYSFKYTVKLMDNGRNLRLKFYNDTLKEYKPDIVIINLNTGRLYRILNLYENKYIKYE